MIGNGLMVLIWLLNTFFGNQGGLMHHVWLFTFKSIAVLVLTQIALAFWASISYGTV